MQPLALRKHLDLSDELEGGGSHCERGLKALKKLHEILNIFLTAILCCFSFGGQFLERLDTLKGYTQWMCNVWVFVWLGQVLQCFLSESPHKLVNFNFNKCHYLL